VSETPCSLKSRLLVVRLLVETLIEALLLPFRLITFFITRKKVNQEIARLLERPLRDS